MAYAISRKALVWLLLFAAAAAFPAACGKKAPPRPPGRREPLLRVQDLQKTLTGSTLRLTWRVSGEMGERPAGFYVYRAKTSTAEPACPGCPLFFERAAAVPWPNAGGGKPPDGRFEYSETLESGFRYVYKVAVYYPDGLTGPDSDLVEITR